MVEHYWMQPNNDVIYIQSALLEMLICFLPCSSHVSTSDQSYQEPNKWNLKCTISPDKQLWIIDWSGFLTQKNVFLLQQLIGLCNPRPTPSQGRRNLREAVKTFRFSVLSETLSAAVHQPNNTNRVKLKSVAHKMPECCCILSQCHRMKQDVSYRR